jgi:hypothetical protein
MICTGKTLDEKDKRIIELIRRKVSYRRMSKIVFLSEIGIKRRVKVMRNYYNCSDTTELIDSLVSSGII